MLASIINNDGDIEIFLSDAEVRQLHKISLKGKIFDFQDIRKRYSLNISIDKEKLERKSSGRIGRDIKENTYLLYIGSNYYQELQNEGWIGCRYGNIKIDVIKESILDNFEEFQKEFKRIKSKEDSGDKIIEKMKKEGL